MHLRALGAGTLPHNITYYVASYTQYSAQVGFNKQCYDFMTVILYVLIRFGISVHATRLVYLPSFTESHITHLNFAPKRVHVFRTI